MALNMCPESLPDNGADGALPNVVFTGERNLFLPGSIPLANLSDVGRSQLGIPMSFSAGPALRMSPCPLTISAGIAPLQNPVENIGVCVTKPQVSPPRIGDSIKHVDSKFAIGACAEWAITCVKYQVLAGVFARCNVPGGARSSQSPRRKPKAAIPSGIKAGKPRHAAVGIWRALLAAKASDVFWGQVGDRLVLHIEPPTRCATPRGVSRTAEALCCPSILHQIGRALGG